MTNIDVAGVYVRISDDRESEETGIARQEEDGRELAGRESLRVHRVYPDNDTGASTKSRKPRPGYDALLADARAGKIGVIIAYSSSRLTRRPLELEGQIELAEKYGVRFVYVRSPSFDLNTADGRQVARMLAASDAAEAERDGERVARAAKQRAEKGLYSGGGRRPYGFDLVAHPNGNHRNTEFVVNAVERDVIRDIAGRLLAGVSLRQVAADLNKAGTPTVTGKARWSGATLRDMLTKPLLAGSTIHDGVEVGSLKGEPILDVETWKTLTEKLTDPSRRNGTGRPAVWLLSGIATCVCNAPLDAGPRAVYRCRSLRAGPGGGGHVRRSAANLDDYIASAIIARFSLPDAADLFARPVSPDVDLPALRREAARLRAVKIRNAEMHGSGDMDDTEFVAASRANKAKLAEVEAQLSVSVETAPWAPLVGVEDVAAAWVAMSLGQQRASVAALVRVRVLPANRKGAGFDESAVSVTGVDGTPW